MISQDVVGLDAQRPRPFGVDIRAGWGGWALPSLQVMNLAATLVVVLYTLVPGGPLAAAGQTGGDRGGGAGRAGTRRAGRRGPHRRAGRCRHRGRHPARLVPPVHPQRGLPDQLPPRPGRPSGRHRPPGSRHPPRAGGPARLGRHRGQPFGLAGSAGSTPLRITVKGDPPRQLFGKLYARSHLRADRWYKLGRELLYGRLEDEKPFNTVRRLVQQEDYALRLCRDAGLPTPRPYGVVELTPEREYLLVTEFFAGAVELGEAEVDRPGDRRRPSRSSASSGRPGWPTATSSRPTCWSATASCC